LHLHILQSSSKKCHEYGYHFTNFDKYSLSTGLTSANKHLVYIFVDQIYHKLRTINFEHMNSRRDFLQKLALSAFVLPVLPETVTANAHKPIVSPPQQGAPLRVALMGLGGYASRVAEAMQSCKRAKITGLIS